MLYDVEEDHELYLAPKMAEYSAAKGGASRHLLVNGSTDREVHSESHVAHPLVSGLLSSSNAATMSCIAFRPSSRVSNPEAASVCTLSATLGNPKWTKWSCFTRRRYLRTGEMRSTTLKTSRRKGRLSLLWPTTCLND
uniref:Uncharacterized protein n=1 Tax=Steinernema glaseri TaxID=37863 RepID=A0A1I7ZFB4_9BILA